MTAALFPVARERLGRLGFFGMRLSGLLPSELQLVCSHQGERRRADRARGPVAQLLGLRTPGILASWDSCRVRIPRPCQSPQGNPRQRNHLQLRISTRLVLVVPTTWCCSCSSLLSPLCIRKPKVRAKRYRLGIDNGQRWTSGCESSLLSFTSHPSILCVCHQHWRRRSATIQRVAIVILDSRINTHRLHRSPR